MPDSRKAGPARSKELDEFLAKHARPRDPDAPEPQFITEPVRGMTQMGDDDPWDDLAALMRRVQGM